MTQKQNSSQTKSKHQLWRTSVALLLFCLVVSPAGLGKSAGAATPSNIFGADFVSMVPARGLDVLGQTNIAWASGGGIGWSKVEPTKGARDWSALAAFEQELTNAAAEGLEPIVTISSTPSWAQAIAGHTCGPIASAELGAFGDFMFDVVNRYKDQVKYWEIWNEPDIDYRLVPPDSGYGCWGNMDDAYYGGGAYASMLAAIYPRIKQADPAAQVLVGGLLLDCDPGRVCPADTANRFLEGILRNNGAAFFDGVAFHGFDYYSGSLGQYENERWDSAWNTTGPVINTKARFVTQVLRSFGAGDKYMLVTEMSLLCLSECTADFETTKAYYLAQAYGSAYSQGLLAAMWYASLAVWRESDLVNLDLSPRPAYYAFEFGSAELDGATFWRNLSPTSGVTGLEFNQGDRRVWLLWSLDGLNHDVILQEIPSAVFDVDGDAISPAQTLTIGLEPIYIELSPGFSLFVPEIMQQLGPIYNGDFNAGLDALGNPLHWDFVSGGGTGLPASLVSANPTIPYLDTSIPQGTYSALLGSTAYPCAANGVSLGYGAVEQTITVPSVPNGKALEIRFDYVIYTQDGSSSAAYDRFEVYIYDPGSSRLVYTDGRSDPSVSCSVWWRIPASGWKTGAINLVSPLDYRGKTVTISFQNWNRFDGWFNTFTYLDNVRLFIGN